MQYTQVNIHWRKPFMPALDWTTPADLQEYENAERHASGYLVHQGQGYTVIATDIRHRGDNGLIELSGIISIPQSAILGIDELVTMSELRKVQDDMQAGFDNQIEATREKTFIEAFQIGVNETNLSKLDGYQSSFATTPEESAKLVATVFSAATKAKRKTKPKKPAKMAKETATPPANKPVKSSKTRARKAKVG